ncbi:GNAT family N-acetyltransferase [Actinomyces faecalis]|uniref:GNAT family N-acetyltransferase n=1 Tax=Actinomyces faecalis TaxID=2722820 RepID=UPI0015537045|nr:GNAT family N-acetyltransferase [Actinomyces faecalis]
MSFEFSLLDTSDHFVGSFDCGHGEDGQSLNQWLLNQAARDHENGICRVHVACRTGATEVLGFYSLSTHTVRLGSLDKKMRGGAYGGNDRLLPALLLGKFAVDQSVQGTGLGKEMMKDAFRTALEMRRYAGILVMALDVRDEALFRYYQHYGFRRLGDSYTMAVALAQVEDWISDH